MLSFEVLDPRSDPEPEFWPALRARAGLRSNWCYDAIRVTALIGRAPMLLVLVRDDAEIVALASTYLSGFPLRRASYAPTTGLRQYGVLDVKAPYSSAQPGWWFAPALTVADRAEVVRAYTGHLRRELGWRVWGIAWRNVRAEDLAWLRTRRALVRPGPAVAELDLPFDRPEEWLASLSRSRAGDLRRQSRRLAEDPNVSAEFGPAATVIEPVELARLLEEVTAKHQRDASRRVHVSVAWLEAMFAAPDTWVLAYRDHAGCALAALLFLDHPQCPSIYAWGARPGVRNLYFDMYVRSVRQALADGRQRLAVGAGMTELKADLGATVVTEHVVLTGLR